MYRNTVIWITILMIAVSSFMIKPLCAETTGKPKAVVVSGASLLTEPVTSYLDKFKANNPNYDSMIMGATTGKGFKKFVSHACDVVMASRAMNEKEESAAAKAGIDPGKRFMGKVCLAVITSSLNPVNEVTTEELRKIFTGEITNWSEIGGPNKKIRVLTRAVPDTGAGVLFQKAILKGTPYAKDAKIMESYGITVLVVSKAIGDAYAIGYVPVSSRYYFDDKYAKHHKTLGIKLSADSPAIFPDKDISIDTKYPAAIPFYMYWNGNTKKTSAKAFAEYISSITASTTPAGSVAKGAVKNPSTPAN